MSVDSVERAGAEPGWTSEIDLGRWVRAAGRRWPALAAIFVLALLAALGLWWLSGQIGEPAYQADADVAIVRTASELTFDERFTTTSGDTPVTAIGARRSALVGLASSTALAQAVIDELGDLLEPAQRNPARLAAAVEATLVTGNGRTGDSDLIRITATAPSPEEAAAIAGAWARAFVRQANQTYGQVPDELLASIKQEQVNAEQEYNAAQAALESFLTTSRFDEVGRQVLDLEATLGNIRQARRDSLVSLLENVVKAQARVSAAYLEADAANRSEPYVREQEGRRQLLLETIDALYGGQSEVFRQRARQDIQLLQDAYARRLQTARALDGARTLRRQVEAAGDEVSGGSALVLEYLKLQALTQLTDPVEPPTQQVTSATDLTVQGELPPGQMENQQLQSVAPTVFGTTQPVQVYTAANPVQVQLDARSAVDKELLLAEVDALIATLDARSAELEQQIAEQSTRLLDADRYGDVGAVTISGEELGAAVLSQYESLLAQGILSPTLALQSMPAPDESAATAGFEMDAELQALAGAVGDPAFQEVLAPLEAQLRERRTEYESLRARQGQLAQMRDLAFETYKTVTSKVAELSVARAAAGSEVRFVAPAVPPAEPVPGLSLIFTLAIGAVAGLLLAALYLLVAELRARTPGEQRP